MIQKLQEMIDSSEKIVFFGGAGVSTESGIPDFRSVDGLYQEKYPHPPEVMLSHSFFQRETEEFFRFYREKMIYLEAKPNIGHTFLANLEVKGKLSAVVTQNIDNLHYVAGSKTVYELHGSVYRNYCQKCHQFYDVQQILQSYHCPCGGVIKPDVVLYEESLPSKAVESAVAAISACDMLIIAGTSLAVYPAASFVHAYTGDKLVVINQSTLDIHCDLMLQQSLGEVFSQLHV